MKSKAWLLLLAGITVIMLISSAVITRSVFTDPEQSTVNTLRASPELVTLLNDGFEGTPWDANWDGNGTTAWQRKNIEPHGGSYYAQSSKAKAGFLTTDDLDTSATNKIIVSFWFQGDGIAAGDFIVQIYNGSAYNTWWDLTSYSSFVDNTWCYFSENITDSQYFKTNFRLRFDTTGLVNPGRLAMVDDVLITKGGW